jgi:nifR3 family TIM-barrel protein
VYVNEMVMATPVVHANAKTHRMISFADDEHPRSQQIYGSDPAMMGEAVHRLCDAGRVDHIDINFGCPAAKVTRRGGGAAVPARPELLRAILRAAVSSASPYGIPVTAKFRMGLFDDWLTHLRTGEVCADEGVAAIAMHARTVEQHYSGEARWDAIGELKDHMVSIGSTIPVLGNGDIWEAHDAVRMMAETGCDGVVIGRGCLGRPWLFADLVDALNGREVRPSRTLGDVVAVMAEHARGLAEHLGEDHAMRDFRKHTGWYMSGYPIGSEFRRRFSMVKSLAELDDILAGVIDTCGASTSIVEGGERIKRGHTRGPTKVSIPDGWLDGQQREALATDLTVPDDDQAMAMSGG